jgi:hypothetical protein
MKAMVEDKESAMVKRQSKGTKRGLRRINGTVPRNRQGDAIQGQTTLASHDTGHHDQVKTSSHQDQGPRPSQGFFQDQRGKEHKSTSLKGGNESLKQEQQDRAREVTKLDVATAQALALLLPSSKRVKVYSLLVYFEHGKRSLSTHLPSEFDSCLIL